MNNGIVGAVCQNKSGKWWTFIRDEATDVKAHYTLRDGDEKDIVEGAKVTFEMRPGQGGATRPSAYNVRLFHADSTQGQRRGVGDDNLGQEPDVKYYLPKDTHDLLFRPKDVEVDNTALKIQKYIPKELKIRTGQTYSDAEKKLLGVVVENQLDLLSAHKYTHCVVGELGSRMVVGLGGASVLETAITLHHTYGFPYIPGTAIKGSLRNFVIRELFGGEEADALSDQEFVDVFGAQGQRGQLIFLDAFPIKSARSGLKLELDIMNPHYAKYYQEGCAPTDDMNPVPIKFYAVPENTQFMFRIVSRDLCVKDAKIKGSAVTGLLTDTLEEIGVGAKTAVGYGWFKDVREMMV